MFGRRLVYQITSFSAAVEVNGQRINPGEWAILAFPEGDNEESHRMVQDKSSGPYKTKMDAEAAALKRGIGFMDLRS